MGIPRTPPDRRGMDRVASLFPGQGSRYTGMLAPLRRVLPGFAERLDALDADWKVAYGDSLAGRHFREPTAEHSAELTQTHNAQPALDFVSIALAATLRELGLRPAYAAGHVDEGIGARPVIGRGGGPMSALHTSLLLWVIATQALLLPAMLLPCLVVPAVALAVLHLLSARGGGLGPTVATALAPDALG